MMGLFDIFRKEKKQSLFELKHHYLKENTELAAEQFLSSLKEARVIVPGRVQGKGATIPFLPDILKNKEVYFFPIFSQEQEIPTDYSERFSFIELEMSECIHVAKNIKAEMEDDGLVMQGFVLDPFTAVVEVDFEALDN